MKKFFVFVVALVVGITISAVVHAARNASGTMSLAAGNPVVSGQTISSTVHNNTMSDIATEITDSLSRSNKGAMLGNLELVAGADTCASPGLTWDGDEDMGFIRSAADTLGICTGGTSRVAVSSTGVSVTGTTLTGDGTVSLPGFGFSGDTDCGMYRIGANNVGVAVAGAKVLDVAAAGLGVTGGVDINSPTSVFSSGVGAKGPSANLPGGFFQNFTAADTTTWQDSVRLYNGGIDMSDIATTIPAKTQNVGDSRITPISFVKAWCNCETDATPVLTDGLNIATWSATGAGANNLQVTFARAMADTTYAVVFGSEAATDLCWGITDKQTTGFEVAAQNCATAAVENLQSTTRKLSFMVIGRQ